MTMWRPKSHSKAAGTTAHPASTGTADASLRWRMKSDIGCDVARLKAQLPTAPRMRVSRGRRAVNLHRRVARRAQALFGTLEAMELPESARELIESGSLAHLVTLNPDGSPQVTCIWVGLENDEIVSGHLRADQRKAQNVARDPRVALSIEGMEIQPPGLKQYLVVYGRARLEAGGAPALLQRLAHVYLGPDVKFPPMDEPPEGHVMRITFGRRERRCDDEHERRREREEEDQRRDGPAASAHLPLPLRLDRPARGSAGLLESMNFWRRGANRPFGLSWLVRCRDVRAPHGQLVSCGAFVFNHGAV